MTGQVGDTAPDFTLTHRLGTDPIRLSDEIGDRPIVLLFFPLAFSGVCRTEICTVAEDYSRWRALDAKVFGISVDSAFALGKFAEETGAEFPLLSDFNKDAAKAYGVLNHDFFGMNGVANRSAFVIDSTGTIVYRWSSDNAELLPPFDEVLEAVRSSD